MNWLLIWLCWVQCSLSYIFLWLKCCPFTKLKTRHDLKLFILLVKNDPVNQKDTAKFLKLIHMFTNACFCTTSFWQCPYILLFFQQNKLPKGKEILTTNKGNLNLFYIYLYFTYLAIIIKDYQALWGPTIFT